MIGLLLALLFAQAPKPKATLSLTPRQSLYFPGHPVLVRARVTIANPSEDMYCPAVEFRWDEGNTSTVEGDCDPVGQGVTPPDFYLSRSMTFGPGEHEITVVLRQGKKELRLTEIASVLGE